MRTSPLLPNILLAVGLIAAANSASAAYINFIEDQPVDESPFTVVTNMTNAAGTGDGTTTINADGVTYDGFHFPNLSPSPLNPGFYIGGLMEENNSTIVSDYVVLDAGSLISGGPNGIEQAIHIDVFSNDISLSDLESLAQTNYGITLTSANFLTEDGTLQDLSGVMGTLPGGVEGITVRLQSSVPEPATLALMGLGVLGLGLSRRRQA